MCAKCSCWVMHTLWTRLHKVSSQATVPGRLPALQSAWTCLDMRGAPAMCNSQELLQLYSKGLWAPFCISCMCISYCCKRSCTTTKHVFLLSTQSCDFGGCLHLCILESGGVQSVLLAEGTWSQQMALVHPSPSLCEFGRLGMYRLQPVVDCQGWHGKCYLRLQSLAM